MKNSEDNSSHKDRWKLAAAILILAAIAAAIYFFSSPKETEIRYKPEIISQAATTSLFGLWRADDAYPFPRYIEFKDGEFCNSWSGRIDDEFRCFGYERYILDDSRIIVNGTIRHYWEIKNETLLLFDFAENKNLVFSRVAWRTATNTPSTTILPSKPAAKPEPKLQTAQKPSPVPLPWITYANAEFGIRISHPPDYVFKRGESMEQNYFTAVAMKRTSETLVNRYVFYAPDGSPLSTNDGERKYITISAVKGGNPNEIAEKTKDRPCVFDSHFSTKIVPSGTVAIGKGNYSARKLVGNECVVGGKIIPDDTIEIFIAEAEGIVYVIEIGWSKRPSYWDSKKIANPAQEFEILKTLELTGTTPPSPDKFKFLGPANEEELRMKEGVYSVRWTPADFEWSDGYATSRSKGGRIILKQIRDDGYGIAQLLGETDYDSGVFNWNFASQILYLDRGVKILANVFPKGVSTSAHNSYFIFSNSFTVKSFISEYPPLALEFPIGGETFKLGEPITIRWSILPKEASNFSISILGGKMFTEEDYNKGVIFYGSILPQKVSKIYDQDTKEYQSIGWTAGMTNFQWDGKTVYVGDKPKILAPGEYTMQVSINMTDGSHAYAESNPFIISP